MRCSKHKYYLDIAKAVSERSTCLRRRYGAVIVNNDEIISTGYNGSARNEQNCSDVGICQRNIDGSAHNDGNYSNCPAVHAEMNAMLSASRQEMLGSTLYLVGTNSDESIVKDCKPCPICERMMKNAGIAKYITYSQEEHTV